MKMRRLIILCVSAMFVAPTVFGQEDKDFSYLFPKQGQFSIGMDMANVIKFVGNSFSSNGTQTPNYSMVTPSSTGVLINPILYGRYFLADNIAIRARLGIQVDNTTTRYFVYDDISNIGNPFNDNYLTYDKTVDERKLRNSQYELGIGMELRKNLWRIQGYAGAELFGSIGYNREYYTYGNAMSATNQSPTSVSNFNNGATASLDYRVLENTNGNFYNYGGGLYVGADLFITKSISIGAEFNFFLYGSSITEQMAKVETYKLNNVYIGETPVNPSQSRFGTSSLGTLNVNIYF